MDLSLFNKICNNTFLPKKKMSELEENRTYMVTQLREVKTRFGTRFVVTLNEEFQMFLPERASQALEKNDNLVEDISERANKYALGLVYYGNYKFEFKTI